jgi:hypothetical protein
MQQVVRSLAKTGITHLKSARSVQRFECKN